MFALLQESKTKMNEIKVQKAWKFFQAFLLSAGTCLCSHWCRVCIRDTSLLEQEARGSGPLWRPPCWMCLIWQLFVSSCTEVTRKHHEWREGPDVALVTDKEAAVACFRMSDDSKGWRKSHWRNRSWRKENSGSDERFLDLTSRQPKNTLIVISLIDYQSIWV